VIPSSCVHNPDYECFDCATERHDVEHPEPVDGCRECKFRGTIQISPRATPTKTRSKAEPRRPDPAWERGVATDERGVPLLDEKGGQIGVKQYAENRHKYDEMRRRLRNDPNVLRPKG
jgi:hypothetical protein